MERHDTRWFAWFGPLAAAALTASVAAPASAETIESLRARAKQTLEPAQSVELSRALRRAGLIAEATNVVQKAFGKARGDEPVADLRLELARIYIEQRAQKKAVRECEQIKKLAPLKEQICQAETQLLHRRGSAALPAAEQALALAPGDYDALVAKGRALGQLGRPTDADSALRDAIRRVSSRPEAYRWLAELKVAQGKTADAVTVLRDGRKVAPDDPDILGLLGEHLPPGKEAREALEGALLGRPSFAAARARLGMVLFAQGDVESAEKMLTQALAADAKQVDWLAALGEVHIAKKQPDLALKDARAALKVVGNHGPAKLVEAKALAQKGDIDLAIQAFEEAYGLLRMDPHALIAAALACAGGGRLTTAKAFADRATEDFPKSAAAWEALGDVCAAMKDTPAAKQAYDKALGGEGTVDREAIKRKRASLK